MPMVLPHELRFDQLAECVAHVQRLLYLDANDQGQAVWNPDKDWPTVDICQDIALTLGQLGLVPESRLDAVAEGASRIEP
jgi:hypothetical protein